MGLTSKAHPAQNRGVTLRAAAASLLILMTLGMSWLGTCGGWEPSLNARMACCAAAKHQCSAALVDACCAAGEQRQHGERAALSHPSLPPLQILAFAPFVVPLQEPLAKRPTADAARPVGSPLASHILLSVFLI
jgi:hypothetical protein